ncbi:MAG: hypothetical protein IPL61_12435 [Myxococcales bacterium]|nr:hypothetical protein [Myxococcales bacterium]
MRTAVAALAWMGAIVVATACGGGSPVDAGGYDPLPPIDASGPLIEAPLEQWTWVPIEGMRCGDGSATGVGVNLTRRSDRVLVFLNGGGACWDAQTCFELRTAASIDAPFGAAEFEAVRATLASYPLFGRAAGSPFQNVSFVFVPYCTGDLHAGHNTAPYTTTAGPRTVAHVGQDNLDALWPRLRDVRPGADRVWLTGASAGGYGAMLEVDRLRAAFSASRVDVLSDSSHPIDPEPARWDAMRAAWSLDLPGGCAACATGFGGWPAHLRATAPTGARWALLMNTRDQTIAAYFGVSQAELAARTLAIRDGMTVGSGQAAFVIDAASHVLTATSPAPQTTGGVGIAAWVRQFAIDDLAWASAGP